MSGTRVLVAGASIAGPALAHWLHRRGAEVTVVERAPGLRPGGQAVDARGVTKEVIRRMGLDAAVRAARTETAGALTVDVDGNVLETFRPDDPRPRTPLRKGSGLGHQLRVIQSRPGSAARRESAPRVGRGRRPWPP